MKLTIKRNEFLRRLSFTAQAVPSRSAEAQYRNYLIEVKEDGVSVIASPARPPLQGKTKKETISFSA